MKTIHRQELPLDLRYDNLDMGAGVTLRLPVGAEIVKVAERDLKLHIWYSFDLSQPDQESRIFRTAFTGSSIPDDYRFIGTVLLFNGSLVIHVFEVPA